MIPARHLRFLLRVLPFVGYSVKAASGVVVMDTVTQENFTSLGAVVTFPEQREPEIVAAGEVVDGKCKTLPSRLSPGRPGGVERDAGASGALA